MEDVYNDVMKNGVSVDSYMNHVDINNVDDDVDIQSGAKTRCTRIRDTRNHVLEMADDDSNVAEVHVDTLDSFINEVDTNSVDIKKLDIHANNRNVADANGIEKNTKEFIYDEKDDSQVRGKKIKPVDNDVKGKSETKINGANVDISNNHVITDTKINNVKVNTTKNFSSVKVNTTKNFASVKVNTTKNFASVKVNNATLNVNTNIFDAKASNHEDPIETNNSMNGIREAVVDVDDAPGFVELKPFVNQVGGHTCVLEIDRQTICKPYVQREVWFYQNVPGAMREFTPLYYGDVDVTYGVVNGKKRLVACIPARLMKKHRHLSSVRDVTNDVSRKSNSKRGKKRGHGCLERPNQPFIGGFSNCENGVEETRTTPTSSESCRSMSNTFENCRMQSGDADYNRWSVQCLERQITRYGFWANNQPQKFIMLGNLVSEYKHPCMMDIKMGRRQYGDDSSEEKRKLLEKRCAKSTSSTLGFRICGTQVYQCAKKNYVIHDKYYGRYLDNEGVASELGFFFHNGLSSRSDVIALIIQKLEKLRSILQTETKLNLFSCSLLLIYDGHVSRDQQPEVTKQPKVTTKPEVMKDLARSNALGQNDGAKIISHITRTRKKLTNHDIGSAESGLSISNSQRTDDPNRSGADPLFDVRLIDFAHVSERNPDESRDDDEEDNIVFGLSNLIDVLRGLLVSN